jgi:DNA/RNA endonuclease G (NUC1)
MLLSPIGGVARSFDDCVFRPLHQVSLGARMWLTPSTTTPSSTSMLSSPASCGVSSRSVFGASSSAPAMIAGALVVGLGVGFGCGIYLKAASRWMTSWRSQESLKRLRRQLPHSTFAPAVAAELSHSLRLQELKRTGYTAMYSRALRSPAWVTYLVSPQSTTYASSVERCNMFLADRELRKQDRWSALDIRAAAAAAGGYDRGHLAPHGAVGCCEDSSAESFLLSNIALQHPKLNRRSWKRLETAVKKYVEAQSRGGLDDDEATLCGPPKIEALSVAAVTVGPLFGRKTVSSIIRSYLFPSSPDAAPAPAKVPIPDAFFMAVFDTRTGRTAAYIATNDARAAVSRVSLLQLESRLCADYRGEGDAEEGGAHPIRLFSEYRERSEGSAQQSNSGIVSAIVQSASRRANAALYRVLPPFVLSAVGAPAAVVHARRGGVRRIDAAATLEIQLDTTTTPPRGYGVTRVVRRRGRPSGSANHDGRRRLGVRALVKGKKHTTQKQVK